MDSAKVSLERAQATLAKNVAVARSVRNLTQEMLANEAGISRATIIKIEAGEGNPPLSTIASLAEALDTSPLLLLLGHDELEALETVFTNRQIIKKLRADLPEEDVAKMKQLLDSGLPRGQRSAVEIGTAAAGELSAGAGILGAAIGTMLMPGIGTLIGAALASFVGTKVVARRSERPSNAKSTSK